MITVEFAHGEIEYRLNKRFLDRPSAELTCQESGRFVRVADGDAADEWTRKLLTNNPPGKGLARQNNWGFAQVLWAPQGSLELTALSNDVVADIRAGLGAQVGGMGSGPIEKQIEEKYDQIFTQGGKFRAGKDAPAVVRLDVALKAAEEGRRQAQTLYQAYEEAARHVEDLRALRVQARLDAEETGKTLSEARKRAERYRELATEATQRKAKADLAETEYGALKRQLDAIATAEKELADTSLILSQLQERTLLLTRESQDRVEAERAAEVALDIAREGRHAVDVADERARQAERYIHLRRDAAALEQRIKRITNANTLLIKRKKERAIVTAPNEKDLRAIRKATKERDEAHVRLDTALISLEVLSKVTGKLIVVEGEEPGPHTLKAGASTIVKGSPEVVVELPGIARLRARGPAGDVDQIRTDRDRAAQRLRSLTEGYGSSNPEELETLLARARLLDKAVDTVETQLSTLLAGETLEALENESARLVGACGEMEGHYPIWRDAPPDAEVLTGEARESRRVFVERVESAEKEWKLAQGARVAVGELRTGLDAKIAEAERTKVLVETRLGTLKADIKQTSEPDRTLMRLALKWEAARAGLEEAENALREFGGDPARDVSRLERQLDAAGQSASEALEKESREEGRLEHLSAQGPYSGLAKAEEEAVRARRELSMEGLRVAALKLLHDTVAQCRTEALDAVAAPVEIAATRILQRISGRRLGPVQLGTAFEPGHVVPEAMGESVAVDHISGGEREQVYLATRLALAEVLARGERQLVVLDDVLTATDAGRLARVMGVLEEAAQRLQLLILTCHPERYRGLEGASFIDLELAIRGAG
jgi:DNA repair exonuclease SbcCD ATPase subunit